MELLTKEQMMEWLNSTWKFLKEGFREILIITILLLGAFVIVLQLLITQVINVQILYYLKIILYVIIVLLGIGNIFFIIKGLFHKTEVVIFGGSRVGKTYYLLSIYRLYLQKKNSMIYDKGNPNLDIFPVKAKMDILFDTPTSNKLKKDYETALNEPIPPTLGLVIYSMNIGNLEVKLFDYPGEAINRFIEYSRALIANDKKKMEQLKASWPREQSSTDSNDQDDDTTLREIRDYRIIVDILANAMKNFTNIMFILSPCDEETEDCTNFGKKKVPVTNQDDDQDIITGKEVKKLQLELLDIVFAYLNKEYGYEWGKDVVTKIAILFSHGDLPYVQNKIRNAGGPEDYFKIKYRPVYHKIDNYFQYKYFGLSSAFGDKGPGPNSEVRIDSPPWGIMQPFLFFEYGLPEENERLEDFMQRVRHERRIRLYREITYMILVILIVLITTAILGGF